MKKPLCIDLYCGLGGWAEGFLSEGYDVVGFDIERHDYGTGGYPGQLVLQDVMTLHGRQFRDAAVIVASPPCQAYSYRAMPWKRAKALPPPSNELFDACFRIQREASEAAGHYIPLIVENVKGAQRWVGRAAWHFGSYYLWGDVPALMPPVLRGVMKAGVTHRSNGETNFHGHKVAMNFHEHEKTGKPGRSFQSVAVEGTKGFVTGLGRGHDWRQDPSGRFNSKSVSRKAASAQIAKIPFPLAQWIARVFKPDSANAASPTRRDHREERQHKEIEELRKFQAECMDIFRGPEQGWYFKEGAWMGMADALAEECMILQEMKEGKK